VNTARELNFFKGISCLPKGIKEILSDKRIFIYTLVPMLLSAVVVYFGFYYGWDWTGIYLKKQLSQYLGKWISENGYMFKIIFSMFNFIAKVVFTVLTIYLGFVLVQIISIPFYALSCERILMKRNLFPNRNFDLGIWIRLNLRLFIISIIRMIIFMFFGIIVFLISFIPGLQVLAMIYSGYVMGIDSMDYTLEIYEMSLGRRFVLYFQHLGFFMGLAVVLLPSLFIPGLTLILLPIAVVGSAVCFAETKGKYEYEKLIA
jgi:CysZ protein